MPPRHTPAQVDRLISEKITRCQARALVSMAIVTGTVFLARQLSGYRSDYVEALGQDWGGLLYDTSQGGFIVVACTQAFIALTWLVRSTVLERQRAALRTRTKPAR